jgi:hypothetical protein
MTNEPEGDQLEPEATPSLGSAEPLEPEAAPSPGAGVSDWKTALTLSGPLGLGWFVTGFGAMSLGAFALSLVLMQALASTTGEEGLPGGGVLELFMGGTIVAAIVLAQLLVRGSPIGRYGLAILGGLQLSLQMITSARGKTPNVIAVFCAFACLALLLPALNRWFTPEGRTRLRKLDGGPYSAAVTWVAVCFAMATILGGAFKRLFEETGIDQGLILELVADLASWLRDYPHLLYPLAILGPLPLLRIPEGKRKPAALALHLAGLGALTTIGLGYVWAVIDLIEKL